MHFSLLCLMAPCILSFSVSLLLSLTKVPLQQISAETLSISITPSIFHTVPQGVHMNDIQALLREGETLADCVNLMIEYHGRIFE